MGHGAWGMEQGAWSMGHGARSKEYGARGIQAQYYCSRIATDIDIWLDFCKLHHNKKMKR
jgi:hypothetical protein